MRSNQIASAIGCLLVIGSLGSQSLPAAEPNRIFFTRLAPVNAALYISNADGSGEHPFLPSTSLDYNPAWSPDGKWIVFTSERDGSADLYRAKLDGSGLERLTDHPAYDDQAAFSPNSKQIVFVSTRGNGHANIWILDLATRKARPLTSGTTGGDFRPSWSPDGKWIAFSSDRGSDLPQGKGRWEHLQIADIYVVHPDGSLLKRLTDRGNFCGGPSWTRDSKRVIAYCMDREKTLAYRFGPAGPGGNPEQGETQLVSIDIAHGATSAVPAGPGVKMAPAVLPTGDIAYVRRDTVDPGIFYSDPPGGRPETGLNSGPRRGPDRGPKGSDLRAGSWSPDGKQLVYERLKFTQAPSARKPWSRNPDYDLNFTAFLPSFDPTGAHYVTSALDVLLVSDSTSNRPRPLYTADDKRNIVGTSWSPRGDSILFGIGAFNVFLFKSDFAQSGRVDNGAQVAMIKPDGSGFHEVTTGANNNGFPSFAPDGKRFVYRTAGPEGQGLRVMDLETRQVTKLTTDYDNFPLWSPRGDLIAFVRKVDGDYEIYTIHPDGTNLKRLTNTPGNDAHGAWSSDGEWLVFSSSRMGFKDEALYTDVPQPYGELFVMRFDGTQVQQLTDNQWEDGGAGWQPVAKVGAQR